LIGLPTLVVRGETSDILSAATLQAMQQRYPAMQTVTVPGIGHAPFLDEPPAREAIDAFLADIPARLGPLKRVKARIDAFRHAGRVIKALKTRA
ncbi:MAG: alpha/beta hydrolase, partial [Alphaproteobacteria bacterium]